MFEAFIAFSLALAVFGPFIALCFGVGGLVFWIYTIIVVLNAEEGSDKTTWVLVVLFLSIIGAVIYHLMRPERANYFGRNIIIGTTIASTLALCLLCTVAVLLPNIFVERVPPYTIVTYTPSPLLNVLTLAAEEHAPTELPNILTAMAQTQEAEPLPTVASVESILTQLASTATPPP